jgi:glycerate-2-kinase
MAIWRAGVDAVDSDHLVAEHVGWTADALVVCQDPVQVWPDSRIVVVGGGKAGAGMAAGLLRALQGSPWLDRVTGWINVPADAVRPLPRIHLHAARPAGLNEPVSAGVAGADRILHLLGDLTARDVCLALISGGGSALLPAPVPGITLEDKQIVTRALMAAGAPIEDLNCVRTHLSRIKGGGLARAAGPARVRALVISDVVGDRLDVVASGPTVVNASTPAQALGVLRRYLGDPAIPPRVRLVLERASAMPATAMPGGHRVRTFLIGSNARALDAAARLAAAWGYRPHRLGSDLRGEAREVGVDLADRCRTLRDGSPGPVRACVLSGGEPVVRLVATDRPRRGGRNQELVLAAVDRLWDDGMTHLAVLSGGTDGEDGPTDAAGAVADEALVRLAKASGLHPSDFLSINNAYPFFDHLGGLLRTGPTHTNVMDVRVGLVWRP